MNRRSWLCLCASAVASGKLPGQTARKPIQLHVDLIVAPGREAELEENYRKVFEPAIRKQPGFVLVRLLKLRDVIAGEAPTGSRYRLIISFETEEQRQKWVTSDDHQRAWPKIEQTLVGAKYIALLYDEV